MTDHSSHNHPATPAGRAACRKSMSAGHLAGTVFAPEIRMTGPVARRMARQAVKADNVQADLLAKIKRRQATEAALRIQPRRSGARVSTRNTTCVQAALHIDAHGGRCACGWEAA